MVKKKRKSGRRDGEISIIIIKIIAPEKRKNKMKNIIISASRHGIANIKNNVKSVKIKWRQRGGMKGENIFQERKKISSYIISAHIIIIIILIMAKNNNERRKAAIIYGSNKNNININMKSEYHIFGAPRAKGMAWKRHGSGEK